VSSKNYEESCYGFDFGFDNHRMLIACFILKKKWAS
jgi:hypothetical protein